MPQIGAILETGILRNIWFSAYPGPRADGNLELLQLLELLELLFFLFLK